MKALKKEAAKAVQELQSHGGVTKIKPRILE